LESFELAESKTINQKKQGENQQPPKIVVLGVGNLLLRDEGVGVHLVHLLKATNRQYSNVELIDAGTSMNIPAIIDKADKLIILDAVNGGKEPGTIYHFNLEEIDHRWNIPLSFHQLGVLDSLRILELLGKKPKNIMVIGIEPKLIEWGTELTPEIQAKLPQVLKLIEEEINETAKCIQEVE